jgi:hypothetical protein
VFEIGMPLNSRKVFTVPSFPAIVAGLRPLGFRVRWNRPLCRTRQIGPFSQRTALYLTLIF